MLGAGDRYNGPQGKHNPALQGTQQGKRWPLADVWGKGGTFQLTPPIAPVEILSLQPLCHYARREAEQEIWKGREYDVGEIPAGQAGKEKQILLGSERWGRGERRQGRQPRGLVPPLLHPPQSWGRGEVLNNRKSSGEISE